jgi:hypothetical protein
MMMLLDTGSSWYRRAAETISSAKEYRFDFDRIHWFTPLAM